MLNKKFLIPNSSFHHITKLVIYNKLVPLYIHRIILQSDTYYYIIFTELMC